MECLQFFFKNCLILLLIANLAVAFDLQYGAECPYLQNAKQSSSASAASEILETPLADLDNYIKKDDTDPEIYKIVESLKKPDPLACSVPSKNCYASGKYAYRNFDGSCNNMQYPGFGMALARYSRLLPPRYGDRHYTPSLSSKGQPLPNARRLSLNIFGDTTYLDTFRTMTLLQFGQFVAHDISQLTTKSEPANCCENFEDKMCYPISLSSYGPIYKGSGKKCLHFARAVSDADVQCPASGAAFAEKISKVTAFLDLSSVYGNSEEESQKTRLFKGGLLKSEFLNNRYWLPVSKNENGECGEGKPKCFVIPDSRNLFTPQIAVLHTLMQREHNRLATELSKYNPHYTDERIFQEARKINIAQYQKIVYYDWLPHILGANYMLDNQLIYNTLENTNDYDPELSPAPAAEFSIAAFRYAHNQIPGWFSMIMSNRHYNESMRLTDFLDRPETIDLLSNNDNFDSLLRGMAMQEQKRADINIDKEVKHHFERKMFEEFGADLRAFDIQRGRDFGLASYNDVRQFCGLPRAYRFEDFTDFIDHKAIAILAKNYESPDDVDLSVGGSLENHLPNTLFGPTFHCVVSKQFLKTRRADRFFFENYYQNSGFTKVQQAEIHKVSLGGLFCLNGDYLQYIQKNVFTMPNERNPIQHCSLFPQLDLSKWYGY